MMSRRNPLPVLFGCFSTLASFLYDRFHFVLLRNLPEVGRFHSRIVHKRPTKHPRISWCIARRLLWLRRMPVGRRAFRFEAERRGRNETRFPDSRVLR